MELSVFMKKWGLTAKTIALLLGKSETTIPSYKKKPGAKLPVEIRHLIQDLDKVLEQIKKEYS